MFSFKSTKLMFRIGHSKEFQRLITRALAPPQTFPVNPQRKQYVCTSNQVKTTHTLIKKKIINQTNGYVQVSFHGRFTPLISYALPFSLYKYIILQKNWSCWYPIWIHIDYNQCRLQFATWEEFVSMKTSMIYKHK